MVPFRIVRMYGVNVEVGRTRMGVVERGLQGCVRRNLVERGCFDLVLRSEVDCCVCLRRGGRCVFDRNGVRGKQVGT